MTTESWETRLDTVLADCARQQSRITYAELAERAEVPGPQRIRRLTEALERRIAEDHAAGRPLRAAVAISKAGTGLPRPGFFAECRALGLYFGPDEGPQARFFHEFELNRLFVNARTAPPAV